MTTSGIRFLNRSQINDTKWNVALEGSSNRNIYAYSWYLDVVSPGWCALVEGDYNAIMPLPIRRKYLVGYVFMPPYCQQLGVFSKKTIDADTVSAFLNAIPTQVRYIDLNLNAHNLNTPASLRTRKMMNLVLQLNREIDTVRDRFSTNHKRNIRKFHDSGLIIERQVNPDEVIRLFETGRGGQIGRYPDRDHKVFGKLFSAVQENARVETVLARNINGLAVGGAVFFEALSGSYFIFSGVSREGRDGSVMHGIIDQYLNEKSTSISFLDFEGSNNTELARFYAGFGANESIYLHFIINKLPFPLNYLKPR